MPVVTGIDILGIQKYVFASNRLRDVLAASWMVDHVVRREPYSLLQWGMRNDRVLLAAGGNAIVEFDDLDDAKFWTIRYTRWLQKEAPGLEIVIAHQPYDRRSLAWGLKALAVRLARAKLERSPSSPQLGLSVTATCSVTGMPATSLDPYEGIPISRQIGALRRKDVQQRAKERWDKFLPERLEQAGTWSAEFSVDFDYMGRSHGETSILGIVHIDGNGIGKATRGWLGRSVEQEHEDERVRAEYWEWSHRIDELGEEVLRAMIKRLAACIFEDKNERRETRCVLRGTPNEARFPLYNGTVSKTSRAALLPLRPILLGGDDLTVVCDGRVALDLAVTALREFENHPIPYLGSSHQEVKLTASAGVALVKAHAPFHRGYELAESLCASAKRARERANEQRQTDTGCWLDWHSGSTRPSETVEAIRRREYEGGNLTMRPYPLTRFDGHVQSWEWLDTELLGPGGTPETANRGFRGAACWAESRNRVQRLRALVPGGRDHILRQIEAWNAIENSVQLPACLPEGGFVGQRTPLLDAIELFDLHVRLELDRKEERYDE